MKLTSFGRFARKLRIERDMMLFEMAEALEVSPSFLSSVERGKKAIPTDWSQSFVEIFSLDEFQSRSLKRSIEQTVGLRKIFAESEEEADLLSTFAALKSKMPAQGIREIRMAMKKIAGEENAEEEAGQPEQGSEPAPK